MTWLGVGRLEKGEIGSGKRLTGTLFVDALSDGEDRLPKHAAFALIGTQRRLATPDAAAVDPPVPLGGGFLRLGCLFRLTQEPRYPLQNRFAVCQIRLLPAALVRPIRLAEQKRMGKRGVPRPARWRRRSRPRRGSVRACCRDRGRRFCRLPARTEHSPGAEFCHYTVALIGEIDRPGKGLP